MSQFLQLGPLDFDPDLGYVRFWGIGSANNHSHISKPHPLNNTDTLGGRFPWPVIQPLVNATGFWNAPPIFLPTHEHHLWCALPEGVGTPFFSTVLLSMRSLIWALLGSGNKDLALLIHMPICLFGVWSFFSSLRNVLRGRHSTSYLAQVCHVFDSGCWLSWPKNCNGKGYLDFMTKMAQVLRLKFKCQQRECHKKKWVVVWWGNYRLKS